MAASWASTRGVQELKATEGIDKKKKDDDDEEEDEDELKLDLKLTQNSRQEEAVDKSVARRSEEVEEDVVVINVESDVERQT